MSNAIDNKAIKDIYDANSQNIETFLSLFNPSHILDPDIRVSCIATIQSISILRDKLQTIPGNIFNLTA